MRLFVVVSILAACAFVSGDPVSSSPLPDGVALSLELKRPEPRDLELNGQSFSRLEIPGAGLTNEVGRPQIPVFRQLVAIPYGAEIEVEAWPTDIVRIELERRIAPVQHPVPKSGSEPTFILDREAYGQDEFGPELGARIVEIAVVRGHRLAVVEIAPVSYNPAENAALVAQKVRVALRWRGADWGLTMRRIERYQSPPFAGRLDGLVVRSFELDDAPPPDLPVGYLVITPDEWLGSALRLAEWRRRKGYNVFVRTLNQVGGSSAEVVRDYIRDAYQNWPIPPSFVLLVGDVDRIGCFRGEGTGNPSTDLNFGLVDGIDYFPDIDVGRASVADAGQLDSLVDKIVGYEQDLWTRGEWLRKAYFIASADGGHHQITEGTHAYVMERLRRSGVECDSLWLYYGSGTLIPTALNGGRSWVTYSGHGGVDCWADPNPDFDLACVHSLSNVEMIPYVQTYACYSGDFSSSTYPECFSEAWIRSGKRGGICHIASSVTSYWTEDDTLERRVFDCMFDSAFFWVMGGLNRAKLIYYQQMGAGGTTRRYFEMYNMMGDGAIDVYASEPGQLDVLHPVVIPMGSHEMTVTVSDAGGSPPGSPVEKALVCAAGKSDTSVFAVAYTDASGRAVLQVNCEVPDTVYVTVSAHNKRTYLGWALALPAGGPYVTYLRHEVADSAGGNNDGIVNPGESINLPMWVRNWGGELARNVRTWLRTQDPNIVVAESLEVFGDIGAGDSAFTGATGFGFQVAASCTNGYELGFTVSSRDANDSVWESHLVLEVGAPVLGLEDWRALDDPPGGNGNRMIDPGETGDLILLLRNTGQGNAHGVTARLRSGDERLVVLDSVGSFGDIARDSIGSNSEDRFVVQALTSLPRESRIPCTLAIRTGGLSYSRTFLLDIGVLRSCDPIPDGPGMPPRYYAYDASDTIYTEAPAFSWVEIRGIGTRLVLSDDQTVQVDLPSEFGPLNYYGVAYGQVSICGNGWVAAGYTTLSSYSNRPLPDSAPPGIIAVCWDDLYPLAGGGVWYYHDAANHRFVIEWDSVHYYSPRDRWDKYEVVLYDSTARTETGDNVILLQYLTANNHTSSTVGLESPDSHTGINYVTDGGYHRAAAPICPGMAIRFTTEPPRPRVGISDWSPGKPGPASLGLLVCGPNPFRARTRMAFTLPSATRVSLGVFDPSGRQVRELFEGMARPGTHSFLWDGCDADGREVSRGVYVFRLETKVGSVARKAVLVD